MNMLYQSTCRAQANTRVLAYMERYTTPPPSLRPLAPPSPRCESEIIVSLMSMAGIDLGTLKVKQTTYMIDVFDKLMSCVGGSLGFTWQPVIISPAGYIYDEAYHKPFLYAREGDVFTLIKADMKDTRYVDAGRRHRR